MELFPRSTKSPLKTYGLFSEGRPFWEGEGAKTRSQKDVLLKVGLCVCSCGNRKEAQSFLSLGRICSLARASSRAHINKGPGTKEKAGNRKVSGRVGVVYSTHRMSFL